jgi:hypothetical protein
MPIHKVRNPRLSPRYVGGRCEITAFSEFKRIVLVDTNYHLRRLDLEWFSWI